MKAPSLKWTSGGLGMSLVCLLTLSLVGQVMGASLPVGPREGMRAPAVSFLDLEGKEIHLGDLRGKVVMLNFWATWCRPCVAEMPDLQRLWAGIQDKRFLPLAVNIDARSGEEVKAFLARTGVVLPVAMDPSGGARAAFQVDPIPATFIIDKEGTIRYRILGARPWAHPDYAAGLKVLMAE